MNKCIFTFFMVITIFLCSACSDDSNIKESKVTEESNELVTEESSEEETKEIIDYEYAEYFDKDIVWGPIDYDMNLLVLSRGKVKLAKELESVFELKKSFDGKYFAIWLVTKECGAKEGYERIIKPLVEEGRTEFGNRTDEEIVQLLEQREKDFSIDVGHELEYFNIVVYLTEEQIVNLECPEDIGIGLYWLYREPLEVSEEGLDFFDGDILPISYGRTSEKPDEYLSREEVEAKLNEKYGEILYWSWSLLEKQWKQEIE